eukprot:6300071-Prymnesium_polylepis.1
MEVGTGSAGAKSAVIDAYAVRNLAPFMNFSCVPNLIVVRVPAAHGDRHYPRVAFMAKRDIKAGEELTYHRDSSATTRGKRNSSMQCHCGAGEGKCAGFI